MAKLPDVDEWARELGKKGAQYALELLKQEYGVSAARLRELAEADREGRCMIVPVKSGQSVYCLQDYFNDTTWKSEKRVKCRTVDFVLAGAKMFETEGFIWRFSEIGEKIFLTREEAKAALAKLNSET